MSETCQHVDLMLSRMKISNESQMIKFNFLKPSQSGLYAGEHIYNQEIKQKLFDQIFYQSLNIVLFLIKHEEANNKSTRGVRNRVKYSYGGDLRITMCNHHLHW